MPFETSDKQMALSQNGKGQVLLLLRFSLFARVVVVVPHSIGAHSIVASYWHVSVSSLAYVDVCMLTLSASTHRAPTSLFWYVLSPSSCFVLRLAIALHLSPRPHSTSSAEYYSICYFLLPPPLSREPSGLFCLRIPPPLKEGPN